METRFVSSPVRDALANLTRSEIERELAEVSRQLTELEAYEQLLRSLREVVADDTGDDEVPTPYTPKTLREGILHVMAEWPNRSWMPAAMLQELENRDWAPNGKNARTQVNNRLASMVDRGELVRVTDGYQLYDEYRKGQLAPQN